MRFHINPTIIYQYPSCPKKRCQRSLIYRTWPVGMAITQTWQRYPKRHQETSKGLVKWCEKCDEFQIGIDVAYYNWYDMKLWYYNIFLIDIGIIIWKIVLYDWNSNVIKIIIILYHKFIISCVFERPQWQGYTQCSGHHRAPPPSSDL